MPNERQKRLNPSQGDNESNAPSTLESAQSYLAASAAAGRTSDGGSSSFSASFATFLAWGEAANLIRSEEEFSFFRRAPDENGQEHEVWFDEASNRWFKATFPNKFGIAWGRKGSATAGEYLTRLTLQNQYFGDDIHLIALVNSGKKLRVITSQPHIIGEHALYEEIQRWFRGLGFSRFESGGCVAWYRKDSNLLVSDAHEGNVIRSPDGILFAIDVNVMKPDQEMRDLIISLLDIF